MVCSALDDMASLRPWILVGKYWMPLIKIDNLFSGLAMRDVFLN